MFAAQANYKEHFRTLAFLLSSILFKIFLCIISNIIVQCVLVHCTAKSISESVVHGLINYIGTIAKFHHLKKFTCKGTLQQVFIRVY